MTQVEAETTRLAPETRLGAVELTVTDLDRSVTFYEEAIGLRTHQREDGRAFLGAGGEDLLVLVEDADAPVESGLAPGDELVCGSLTPRRHHDALAMPDRSKSVPLASIAPQRPVFNQLATDQSVVEFTHHAGLRTRASRHDRQF